MNKTSGVAPGLDQESSGSRPTVFLKHRSLYISFGSRSFWPTYRNVSRPRLADPQGNVKHWSSGRPTMCNMMMSSFNMQVLGNWRAPSERLFLNSGRNSERCSRAAPPPGTMPSSTAANVAFFASSIRSCRSSSSTSVAAPTCAA